VTEGVGNAIRLRVIGKSEAACEARYTLEVSSASSGGRTRSVQHGIARLAPGTTAVVATSTLAGATPTGWIARLSIEGCGTGNRYEEISGASRGATP
jgi:hypothetical protein